MSQLPPVPKSLLALVAVALCGGARAGEFADLARYLPNDANAVIVVNASALYASPLGQQEGWQKSYADAFAAAPMVLPPSAERCILAAELELSTLRPTWQTAAMHLAIDPSPADIARRRGGRNDVLAGREVTWLGQACILKFAPRTFGLITAANRQQAARWADAVRADATGRLSPYLQQAIGYADSVGTELILAVDLAGAFHEAPLRAAAAQAEELKGVSPDAAAAILASVQGVKFGVLATDRLTGRLQLDFEKDVAPLAGVAKPLLLKIVGKAGAMLPEFADWTPEVGPRSLALKGDLTADGMRRIFSLLAIDASTLESAAPDQAATTTVSADDEKAAMGQASLRYFRGVSKYVEDLNRLQQAGSLGQAVMWIENYARKVESLPARNVDPDLLEYGKYVAQVFRSIVDQASGLAGQVDAASTPVVTNYHIGWLPTARTVNYGGYFERQYAPYARADVDEQATLQQQQQVEGQVAQAVEAARKTLAQLVTDNETVRTKLSAKYGLKF